MADKTIHYSDCLKQLGNEYKEINDWFDELMWVNTEPDFGHRKYRHNMVGIEEAVKLFGEVARDVGRVHICRDLGGIPLNMADFERGNFVNWKYYKD